MKNFEAAPIAKRTETVVTPEQKELVASAVTFAEYLTDRWPQVDVANDASNESKLNYYLSGSLATMLLSRAERFTEMDETRIPVLAEGRARDIPESARKILASFARQIGDIDYVPTEHYKSHSSRLRKGGGGPSFDEIPPEGRNVLKKGEHQIKVMCDSVETYGKKSVAKVQVEGKDYYIARPDSIFGYKVLHLLQSYEQKPEKFNADFGKLLGAFNEMYRDDELLHMTQQVLTGYEEAMARSHSRLNEGREHPPTYEKNIPKFIDKVLANQQASPEIRATLEKLRG